MSALDVQYKGPSVETLKDIELVRDDPKALRVVVPIDIEGPIGYYVLISPDNDGVCETMGIKLEEVFFAPEFQNDTLTAVETRRKGWAGLSLASYYRLTDFGLCSMR